MQSQAVQTVNSTQSIAYVKTLLQAGLGCITYLRNLLPADNFSNSYLTCESHDESQSMSAVSRGGKNTTSGVRMMTVNRGFTEEADQLLNYLENGIFDALEKQYLRSFIFAIFLDNKDPNNIVEAYTFNVHYHHLPGTDIAIPILSLGDDLMKMSLGDPRKNADPASEASKKGKAPTLGEVQKSLKQLIKTLIQATTHMETLPKRRYATFKLFYTDKTPADYEPQHFRPGDADADKFFFTTHGTKEAPEKFSVGQLETGHHGVNVGIQSIVAYLPSIEDNDAAFIGTTTGAAASILTPLQEANHRAQQVELQAKDASERNVVWDAEHGLGDADAEGEDDPDYVDGVFVGGSKVNDSGVEFLVPIGIRNEEGVIMPIKLSERGVGTEENEMTQMARKAGSGEGGMRVEMDIDDASEEAHFGGFSERVPLRAGELQSTDAHVMELSQTQQIEATQMVAGNSPTPRSATLRSFSKAPKATSGSGSVWQSKGSFPSSSINQTILTQGSISGAEIETQMLMDMVLGGETGDTEMLDMETQVMPSAETETEGQDSIESYPSEGQAKEPLDVVDHGLDCDCGVTIQDESCFCDGGCGRWYHLWCNGYHTDGDPRIPTVFICFNCRIRGDKNWAMIAVNDLLPNMISKFNDLALFRRSIKIVELHDPDALAKFTKIMGCEVVVAGQLFKRLETEGFIAVESTITDELGLLSTRVRSSKGKSKVKGKAKARKEIQKAKYYFVESSKKTAAYADYFNPDVDVERCMMGLSEADIRPRMQRRQDVPETLSDSLDLPVQNSPINARGSPTPTPSTIVVPVTPGAEESQTQDETQFIPRYPAEDLKRKSSSSGTEMQLNKKKIKISMGPAVDLQD